VELQGAQSSGRFPGARIGTTGRDFRTCGSRLDVQPHKYDTSGHTITLKSSGGDYGLRFETSGGKVTAIHASCGST
jgi:hypothetical protein